MLATLAADRGAIRDSVAVALLGAAALGGFSWLLAGGDADLSRFFGAVSPLAAAGLAIPLGVAGILIVRHAPGFTLASNAAAEELARSLVWLALFCAVATASDLVLHFPADLNIAAPAAFVFYPSIAFIAEVVFHLGPLALVLTLTNWLSPAGGPRQRSVIAIALVALIEPVFQVFATADGALSPIREAITFANVYAFGVVQLVIFRRHGFVAMYLFRLGYYAWWHVAWGALRLDLDWIAR